MVTEMITMKLERTFLEEIDTIVKKEGYQNRTEYIRNALRQKVEEARLRDAMASLARLKGASKKKTTEKEYEAIRKKAFEEIAKRLT